MNDTFIFAELKEIKAQLERLSSGDTKKTGAVATDDVLDGQWGDPIVRAPRSWQGTEHDGFDGKNYSECTVAVLEKLAGFIEWRASNDAGKARGWAARLRKNPAQPNAVAYVKRSLDEEILFGE